MEELDRGSSQFFLYTVVVTLPWMNFPGVVDFTKQTELCLLRPKVSCLRSIEFFETKCFTI